jgi:hypothetical protein
MKSRFAAAAVVRTVVLAAPAAPARRFVPTRRFAQSRLGGDEEAGFKSKLDKLRTIGARERHDHECV